jgi:hypothetical protein
MIDWKSVSCNLSLIQQYWYYILSWYHIQGQYSHFDIPLLIHILTPFISSPEKKLKSKRK